MCLFQRRLYRPIATTSPDNRMLLSHEREKLINAIIFFADNTRFLGKTKLCKLLYFLDFGHFKGMNVGSEEPGIVESLFAQTFPRLAVEDLGIELDVPD